MDGVNLGPLLRGDFFDHKQDGSHSDGDQVLADAQADAVHDQRMCLVIFNLLQINILGLFAEIQFQIDRLRSLHSLGQIVRLYLQFQTVVSGRE